MKRSALFSETKNKVLAKVFFKFKTNCQDSLLRNSTFCHKKNEFFTAAEGGYGGCFSCQTYNEGGMIKIYIYVCVLILELIKESKEIHFAG